MSKRFNIILLVLFISALVLVKQMKYSDISNLNLPNWLFILLTFLIASGTLIWGISGVKYHRNRRPKKPKRKFISTEITPADLTLSYGQIIGGIMGIIYVISWIVTYGLK